MPIADSEAQTSTPAELPRMADVAARRPSRAATRSTVAVVGPGVTTSTSATSTNSTAVRRA